MPHQKIQSVIERLRDLAGNIPPDQWVLVRNCIAELNDAAEQSQHLVQHGICPGPGMTIVALEEVCIGRLEVVTVEPMNNLEQE